MKPKNRVMCPDCGRPKMLFETEKKAQNFLKFNMNEVNPNGTRTMRVYYCPACCGYHISSHEYKGDNMNTDRLIEKYKETLAAKGDVIKIQALKLCDELVKMNFNGKGELNRYLKSLPDEQKVKDMARECFYQRTGLNKIWSGIKRL